MGNYYNVSSCENCTNNISISRDEYANLIFNNGLLEAVRRLCSKETVVECGLVLAIIGESAAKKEEGEDE